MFEMIPVTYWLVLMLGAMTIHSAVVDGNWPTYIANVKHHNHKQRNNQAAVAYHSSDSVAQEVHSVDIASLSGSLVQVTDLLVLHLNPPVILGHTAVTHAAEAEKPKPDTEKCHY